MAFTKREKYILIITIAAVSILLADKYIISPSLAMRAEVKDEKQRLTGEIEQANILLKRRNLMERKWQDMLEGGLENDASKTESKVLRALRDWSSKYGVKLSSVKPDQISSEGNLQEITFLIAGTGSMRDVSQFLWQVETSSLPVKIKDIQLGSRNENADDMSLQLRLSAIYLTENGKEAQKEE